jgi:small-conductance mechanosensitive channel
MVRIPVNSYSFRFKPLDRSMKRSVANPVSLLYFVLIAFVLIGLLLIWPTMGAEAGAMLLPVMIIGAIIVVMMARKRPGEPVDEPPDIDD